MSAPLLLRFGSEGILKVFTQRVTNLLPDLMYESQKGL